VKIFSLDARNCTLVGVPISALRTGKADKREPSNGIKAAYPKKHRSIFVQLSLSLIKWLFTSLKRYQGAPLDR
jgi:hypothetical protein